MAEEELDEATLKRSRSAHPADITHDEDGTPLPPATTADGPPVLFSDDEDELVIDDDADI